MRNVRLAFGVRSQKEVLSYELCVLSPERIAVYHESR